MQGLKSMLFQSFVPTPLSSFGSYSHCFILSMSAISLQFMEPAMLLSNARWMNNEMLNICVI